MLLRQMFRRLAIVVTVLTVAFAVPAFAQTYGAVKGKVFDGSGQPVVDAKVTIEYLDGVTRKYEVKSDKKGDFIQIGLQPGNYKVTATKEGVGTQSFDVRVRLGAPQELKFVLTLTAAEVDANSPVRKAFAAGVAAIKEQKFDEAITHFNESVKLQADCYECYFNLGIAQMGKEDWTSAITTLTKASELRPDSADPYLRMADAYSALKKFDDAAKMTEEANKRGGGGATGDADQLFSQGVVFWNAGKIAEAKAQFDAALAANPNHAEAHYWAGMARLNEGNLADAKTHFEKYVELAPNGQYAANAKQFLATMK